MATNIGPKIGIDGEAEYRRQINDIIQQTKTLKSEYEKAASAIDNSSTSFKQNKELSKALTDQINAQKDKVEKLGEMTKQAADKFGESDTKTLKWKEALNKAETELNNLQQTLKEMPSQVELLGNKLEAAGNKIKDVGGKVESLGRSLAPLSTAAAGALTGSAKAAIDFESAFTGVRKTVDGTEEDFEQLSDWIKEASTQMASSKEDIAGTMEIAGQLGVSGVNNLESFTKTMIMLGDTTNLSSEEAASALAKFMNITGESTGDVDKIGASIVDLGNHFATTEADIVNMSTRLASAGTIVGLSSTDILALSTAMSSVGIEAEAGGTAMSQTLKKIQMAVEAGDENLETYGRIAGMSADEFAEKWKSSPIEAIEGFIKGLGRLNEEDESVISTLDDLGLKGIRQSNMLQALALSSDNLSEAVHTSSEAYAENNALQEEAEKRYSTTESKLSQAKEKISNVGIEIGERLLPYLDKGLDFLDKVIAAWDKLSPETQDMIVKITAITAALSPALIVGGKLISGVGSIIGGAGNVISIIGKVGGVLTGGGGLITALGSVATFITGTAIPAVGSLIAAAAPILAAAAPFIAVGAAIVAAGVLIYKNWDTIKEKAGELKDEFIKEWNSIKEKAGELKDSINEKWDSIKEKISDTTLGKAMGAAWDAGKKVMLENLESMKAKYDEYGGGIKGATAAMFEGVKDYFTSGFRFIDELTGGKLSDMVNSFKDKFTNISDNVKEKWNTIKNNTSTILDGLKSKVEENGGGIQGVIRTSTEIYVKLWKNAFNSIDEATGGKLTVLKDKISETFNNIKDTISTIIDNIKKIFDFEWKLPDIKTPHFSVSGGEAPWGIAGRGSLPEFSIEWYSKAMNRGMLLTGATIFGASGDKLLGGGEAGNEIVIGETSLMSMIRAAVNTSPKASGGFTIGDTVINIYSQPGQDARDIADQVDEILTARYAQMEAVWA